MPKTPIPEDDLLAKFLDDRYERCPSCGYDLKGLQRTACPECGQRILLSINVNERAFVPFIVGLITLSFVVGFYTITSAAVLWFVLLEPNMWPDVFYAAFGLAINGPLLSLWIFARRRIARQRRMIQWVLAAVCCALVPINAAVMIALIG